MRTSRERTTFRVASIHHRRGTVVYISSTMFYLALEFLVRFLLLRSGSRSSKPR